MSVIELPTESDPVRLIHADCRDALRALPDGCIDAVVTDPPYPEIDREYGRWTEAEWFDLMNPVVEQCRRVLKPSGSAVFVLQPNSERVGRMRTWLWEFMADWGKRWGMVQDAWWWNYTALPSGEGIKRHHGLMRGSVKACVWLGPEKCFRDQDAVLWSIADGTIASAKAARLHKDRHVYANNGASRLKPNNRRTLGEVCQERGGATPFNLLPIASGDRWDSGSVLGHSAATPNELMRWWVRYICPRGGLVVDPFHGSGTTAKACLAEGRLCLGIERKQEYIAIAEKRLAEPLGTGGLFDTGEPVVTSLFD